MLIHTYFTDGFYKFGKIFIISFKNIHGDHMPLVATTRNLSDEQIEELKSIYSNIKVLNKRINIKHVMKKTGLNRKVLKEYKRQIEYECIKGKNVIWKQYISVEDRYRNSILEAMKHRGNENFMMHIDADSFIRKSLEPIFNLIEENDVSLIFRNTPKKNRKIFGTLSGYKLGKKTDLFMNTWIKHIDKKPLVEKPVGYGQTSCYRAYLDLKKSDIKWGNIPKSWINPNLNKNALIWSGNHSRGKTDTIQIFENQLK